MGEVLEFVPEGRPQGPADGAAGEPDGYTFDEVLGKVGSLMSPGWDFEPDPYGDPGPFPKGGRMFLDDGRFDLDFALVAAARASAFLNPTAVGVLSSLLLVSSILGRENLVGMSEAELYMASWALWAGGTGNTPAPDWCPDFDDYCTMDEYLSGLEDLRTCGMARFEEPGTEFTPFELLTALYVTPGYRDRVV